MMTSLIHVLPATQAVGQRMPSLRVNSEKGVGSSCRFVTRVQSVYDLSPQPNLTLCSAKLKEREIWNLLQQEYSASASLYQIWPAPTSWSGKHLHMSEFTGLFTLTRVWRAGATSNVNSIQTCRPSHKFLLFSVLTCGNVDGCSPWLFLLRL